MINIYLVSAGVFHPPWYGRWVLRRMLHRHFPSASGYHFTEHSSLEQLHEMNLRGIAAIVVYIHQRTISPSAMAALAAFISQGGGLLALHSATASFKQTPAYFEILGGRFSRHGPVNQLDVEPADGENAPFDGLPGFRIRDELYIHELWPDVRIHFQVEFQGSKHPVVWTRRYGAGKVCYLCPGHTVSSLQHPVVQEIIQRGLEWVSGGNENG